MKYNKKDFPGLFNPPQLSEVQVLSLEEVTGRPFAGKVKLSRLIEGLAEILEQRGDTELTVTMPTAMALIILE